MKVTNFRELFFASGHNAVGPDFQARHPGDAVAQTRDILENLSTFIAQAGYSPNDIVRIEATVTKEVGQDDFNGIMELVAEFFADVEVKPSAGSYRVVDGLAVPGTLVEYEFLIAR